METMPITLMHVIPQSVEVEISGLVFRQMIKADVAACNAVIAALSRISPSRDMVL